jgi:uridine kinase
MRASADVAGRRWIDHRGLRTLRSSRLFWAVLVLKLCASAWIASSYMRDLFVPFVDYFVESGFENPWRHFAAAGELRSFPYPPVMLYLLALPRLLVSPLVPDGSGVGPWQLLAMHLPILACDLGIVALLARAHWTRVRAVLLYYWCSPLLFYICYWHGQLDVIPTFVFLVALTLMKEKRDVAAAIVLGVALATKSHLLVVVPFVFAYSFQERGWRRAITDLAITTATYLALVAPFVFDAGFRQIVYGTDEQQRLFESQVQLGELSILLAPAAIVLLWFRLVAYPKRNWDLFMLYMGILFSVFILLAPPRPGYFLWSLPFVVYFLCRSARASVLPYVAYSLAYLLFRVMREDSDVFDALRLISPHLGALAPPFARLPPDTALLVQNLLFTIVQASLLWLIVNMYRFGIRSNAVYRARTMPTLIGLAGDSAAGKDTFSTMITDLLGRGRVTTISGDDYHHWPRGDAMWRRHTHLDPKANDLHQQHEHAIALAHGRTVIKGAYDHATGDFTEEVAVDPSEYIVFQGLHTLSIGALRDLYDLKIFLDPDEELRAQWKIQRDSAERGHPAEAVRRQLDERARDRERYILPQEREADLVVRWRRDATAGPETRDAALVLEVRVRNEFNLYKLVEALGQRAAVRIDYHPVIDPHWQTLSLEGTASASAIAVHAIAQDLVANLDELAPRPRFSSGADGCLQLLFLFCLGERMRWRGGAEL